MFLKLWKEIQSSKVKPIYLLYGTESFLINETKHMIRQQILSEGNDEFNYAVYDLEETPIQIAVEECQTIPFFGEKKVVLLQNPHFLTAEKRKGKEKVEHNLKVFEEYVQNPSQSTVLIIIAPYEKLDERKKLTKLLLKNTTSLQAKQLSEKEVKQWIEKQVRDNNQTITENGVERLYELIGPNLLLMNNELAKILLYARDSAVIDENIVDLLVSRSLEDNVFTLVHYVVRGNLQKTLEIFHDLLKLNEDPIKILALIATQFRLLGQVKTLVQKGYGQKQIASLLKVHPYRVKLAMEETRNLQEKRLINMMNDIAELDYQMKTGRGDKKQLLELFFIKYLTYRN